MRKLLKKSVLGFFIVFSTSLFAQKANVGIGTSEPNKSAILDITASDKGLLIPRMSKLDKDKIHNPATGLMVYQTNQNPGFYFFNGTQWKPLSSNESHSISADPNDWTMEGNIVPTVSTAVNRLGTSAFVGTLNNAALVFKTNGTILSGFISPANENFFLGVRAGKNINGTTLSGFRNVGLGTNALENLTTGGFNLAAGFQALRNNISGGFNVALGAQALENNTASGNTAIGYQSLFQNTTGSANLALGQASLKDNTTGGNNVAIGYGALTRNTSGAGNISIGQSSLPFNLIGSNNTAIGFNSGFNAVGSGNLFIGRAAGYNETGSNKLYIANSSTPNPLIKGEFDNKNLQINTGSSTSSTVGFLAVGNFDATFAMPANNSYRLIVQDGIITEKVKVALKSTADWADYVFEPEYKENMLSLEEIERFIKFHKHLPNVPSAQDLKEKGLDVGETSKMFMEKIEELTLYLIDLSKEVKILKTENESLKSRLK